MKKWIIHRDGQSFGPFVSAEIRDGLRTGAIDPFDVVAPMDQPHSSGEIIEMMDLFEAVDHSGSLLAPQVTHQESPQAESSQAGQPTKIELTNAPVKSSIKLPKLKLPEGARVPPAPRIANLPKAAKGVRKAPDKDRLPQKNQNQSPVGPPKPPVNQASAPKNQDQGFAYQAEFDGPNGVEKIQSGYLGGAARLSPSQNKRPLKRMKQLEERRRLNYQNKKYLILKRQEILMTATPSEVLKLYKKGSLTKDMKIQKISGGRRFSPAQFARLNGIDSHSISLKQRNKFSRYGQDRTVLWALLGALSVIVVFLGYLVLDLRQKSNQRSKIAAGVNQNSFNLEQLRENIAKNNFDYLDQSQQVPLPTQKVSTTKSLTPKKASARPKRLDVLIKKTIAAKPTPKPLKVQSKKKIARPKKPVVRKEVVVNRPSPPAYTRPPEKPRRVVPVAPANPLSSSVSQPKFSPPTRSSKALSAKLKPAATKVARSTPQQPVAKSSGLANLSNLGSKQGQVVSVGKLKFSKSALQSCSPPKCNLTMTGDGGRTIQVSFFKMAPVFKKLSSSGSTVEAKGKVLSGTSILLLDIK